MLKPDQIETLRKLRVHLKEAAENGLMNVLEDNFGATFTREDLEETVLQVWDERFLEDE